MSKPQPAEKPAVRRETTRADHFIVYVLGTAHEAVQQVLPRSYRGGMEIIQNGDPGKLENLIFVEAKFWSPSVVMIDHAFNHSTLDLVYKSMERNLPVVIGPGRKLPEKVWELKSDAQARGLIFEIATSLDDYRSRIDSTFRAILSRWEYEHHSPKEAKLPTIEFVREKTKASEPLKDELLSLPGVTRATQLLRSESGRLDAARIQEIFGLNRTELSELIGVTAESVRQTPDSKKIQSELQHFERIAGLLTLVKIPDIFRKWLNSPNSELDDHSPLDLIKEKRWDVVENLVADVLENRGR